MTENALTTFHQTTALTNPADFDNAISQAQAKAPAVSSGNPYLKLGRHDGLWYYGEEDIEVQEGSHWAINVYGMTHGLVCWSNPDVTNKAREVLGETMVAFNADAPVMSDQKDYSAFGGKWKDQVGFDLICLNGEDEGVLVEYSASSGGACKAYKKLLADIEGRPSPDHVFPIIEMKENHYDNTKYGGITYNPEFEVVDWADNDQNLLSETSETKPKRKPRAKAKPAEKAAEETTETAPAGQEPPPEEPPAADEGKANVRRRRRRPTA